MVECDADNVEVRKPLFSFDSSRLGQFCSSGRAHVRANKHTVRAAHDLTPCFVAMSCAVCVPQAMRGIIEADKGLKLMSMSPDELRASMAGAGVPHASRVPCDTCTHTARHTRRHTGSATLPAVAAVQSVVACRPRVSNAVVRCTGWRRARKTI